MVEGKGIPISDMVNQEIVAQLQQMEFSKAVAEKALFMTQGKTIEEAMAWIEEHQNDADFEEELFIVEDEKPKLSEEEAKKKARELQGQLKAKRDQEEKELERQQEKDRIRITKELQIAQQKTEEAQRKRDIDERKREKQQYQSDYKKIQEQLRRDKEERFGKKYEEIQESVAQTPQKTPQERIEHAIRTVKTLYPEARNPGVAKTCLNTLKIYTTNALNKPEEEKFRQIRKENKAFQDRVAKVNGGVLYLKAVGFEDAGDIYQLNEPNPDLLSLGIMMLEQALVGMG